MTINVFLDILLKTFQECVHVSMETWTPAVRRSLLSPSTVFGNSSDTCAFFQRDRITSFRKAGMKKEKPLIQHPTDPLSTQSELPIPQPLFDDRSLNLSEKEIIDLFEKMMVSFCMFCTICPRSNVSVSLLLQQQHLRPLYTGCAMKKEKCFDQDSSKSCFSEIFGHVLPLRLLFEYFASH